MQTRTGSSRRIPGVAAPVQNNAEARGAAVEDKDAVEDNAQAPDAAAEDKDTAETLFELGQKQEDEGNALAALRLYTNSRNLHHNGRNEQRRWAIASAHSLRIESMAGPFVDLDSACIYLEKQAERWAMSGDLSGWILGESVDWKCPLGIVPLRIGGASTEFESAIELKVFNHAHPERFNSHLVVKTGSGYYLARQLVSDVFHVHGFAEKTRAKMKVVSINGYEVLEIRLSEDQWHARGLRGIHAADIIKNSGVMYCSSSFFCTETIYTKTRPVPDSCGLKVKRRGAVLSVSRDGKARPCAKKLLGKHDLVELLIRP